MSQKLQIISAPSILGLKPTGVEQLAHVLLSTGRLSARLGSCKPVIEVPTLNGNYSYKRDLKTKCLNPTGIQDFARVLKGHIAEQIDRSIFPLVLGGDCSILIGVMAGLRSKGNFGLIFLDGHADFYAPAESPTGEVADMDLAIVTGRGPDDLTNIDGLRPYVEDGNVIHIGQRDTEETRKYGSQDVRETAIRVFDLNAIKANGIGDITGAVTGDMGRVKLDGFWIHFDTDVISDDENPAVDYRLPDGMSFNEVEYLLHQLVNTGQITGLSVTIFNPVLDRNGEVAVRISDCLAVGLSGRAGK